MQTIKIIEEDSVLLSQPVLIEKFGRTGAQFLSQLHYWLEKTSKCLVHDGYKWIYNTGEQWGEQLKLSQRQIRRYITNFQNLRILKVEKLNSHKSNRTNYYTINYQNLDLILGSSKKGHQNSAQTGKYDKNTHQTRTNVHCDIMSQSLGHNGTMYIQRLNNKDLKNISESGKEEGQEILNQKNLNQKGQGSKNGLDKNIPVGFYSQSQNLKTPQPNKQGQQQEQQQVQQVKQVKNILNNNNININQPTSNTTEVLAIKPSFSQNSSLIAINPGLEQEGRSEIKTQTPSVTELKNEAQSVTEVKTQPQNVTSAYTKPQNNTAKTMLQIWNNHLKHKSEAKLSKDLAPLLVSAFKTKFENNFNNWEIFVKSIASSAYLNSDKFCLSIFWALKFSIIDRIRNGEFGTNKNNPNERAGHKIGHGEVQAETQEQAIKTQEEMLKQIENITSETTQAKQVRKLILKAIGALEYYAWFHRANFITDRNGNVKLQAPNSFFESIWEDRFEWVSKLS